jgi:hypothetical protein
MIGLMHFKLGLGEVSEEEQSLIQNHPKVRGVSAV